MLANAGSGLGTLALKLVDDDSVFDPWLNKLGGVGTTGDADGGLIGFIFDDFSDVM